MNLAQDPSVVGWATARAGAGKPTRTRHHLRLLPPPVAAGAGDPYLGSADMRVRPKPVPTCPGFRARLIYVGGRRVCGTAPIVRRETWRDRTEREELPAFLLNYASTPPVTQAAIWPHVRTILLFRVACKCPLPLKQ